MNPFLLSPQERLADWKTFRDGLRALDEDAQLNAVARYWAQAPLSRHAYDAFELDKWPSPWEMIHAGEWCRDSTAVGMEFTLRLAGWSSERMRLLFIRDYDISDQMLVLEIDGTHLLNYSCGYVTPIPDTNCVVLASWTFQGKKYGDRTN